MELMRLLKINDAACIFQEKNRFMDNMGIIVSSYCSDADPLKTHPVWHSDYF